MNRRGFFRALAGVAAGAVAGIFGARKLREDWVNLRGAHGRNYYAGFWQRYKVYHSGVGYADQYMPGPPRPAWMRKHQGVYLRVMPDGEMLGYDTSMDAWVSLNDLGARNFFEIELPPPDIGSGSGGKIGRARI